MVTRRAVVAGHFYPRFKPDLLKIIRDSFLDKEFGPGEEFKTLNKDERTIIGGVSPHAGYVHSGCAAAFTFLNLFKEKIPNTIIVLGTDHIGYGKVALMSEGEWETPLGNIRIDKELSEKIIDNSNVIINDESAFIGHPFGREHNIEVQLPFIKYCAQEKDVKFIPIKVSIKDFNVLSELSNDIAKAIESYDKDVVIVASSDMTHKQPRNISNPSKDLEDMRKRDQAVIDDFVDLDPKNTLKAAQNTSVCGAQTITSLMLICIKLGATKTEALKYYTSYEKGGGSGPCEYSVGYFSGILIK